LGWLIDIIVKTLTLFATFSNLRKSGFTTEATIEDYNALHKVSLEEREKKYMSLVNYYYNVSTAFYEWAWGSSFHFANRKPYEDQKSAILRHEAHLAHRMRLQPGQKVVDVGCGIGGPLRNIAEMTGAHITGINNNDYQISRGEAENKKVGLDKTCGFLKNDFCHMSLKDNSMDAAYAIEATCHAPKREDVYGEIFRVLKPGAIFGCYEWCLTDNYNPNNAKHKEIKKMIEIGNGLPDIAHTSEVDAALPNVGFKVLETRDVIAESPNDIPWYDKLEPAWFPPKNLQFTGPGKFISNKALRFMEIVGIVPKGTYGVSEMLQVGGEGLTLAGQQKIFTPAYFFLAQKPL
jgi:sterol 24-C-methyltransferase